MNHDNSKRTGWTGPRARVASLSLLLIAAAGCGIREYPHELAARNPNDDFGPSAGTGAQPAVPIQSVGASGTVGRVGAAGSGGRSPSGAAGVTGVLLPMAGKQAVIPPSRDAGAAAGTGAAGMAPSAPSTGPTLDLGGTAVAKDDVIAFIHFGHSNMAGRATGPTASRPYFFTQPDPRAWMYHVGKPPAAAKEPDTAGDEASGLYGGPGTALVKQAAALAPTKYFMSLGFGKSSAYCSQFLPGGLYYTSLMAAAMAIKDRVTFGAIVIMLGITERHGTAADISGYSGCINKLVTAIRTDLGQPDLPLLITDYEQLATGALAVNQAFPQSIIPEIHKIPSVVSNSALVPTDSLGMEDDHHFNFDGHKVWTGRVLQIMKDKGWFPWQ